MHASQAIGVFDSGLGGLSVYRRLRRRLPSEDVLYFADSAYCPYGIRSPLEIRDRCERITQLLVSQGAKIIVVACNTGSSMAIDSLRETFPDISFVGLEPAVKPAAAMSESMKIGVLATPRTVGGERLKWLIDTHARQVEVWSVAGIGLVELVESGTLGGPKVVEALRPLLDPMLEKGVDVVVLGCTHYPFLLNEIEAYVGPDVAIIDSGEAIARRTRFVLNEAGLLRAEGDDGTFQLLTSAPVDQISRVASMLIEREVKAEQVDV